MASPYGHGLIGLGIFNFCYPRWFASGRKTFLMYGLVVLGACLPDLDFLPGIFSGNPSRFHHGPFHSLGLAMGLSLIVGLLVAIFVSSKIEFITQRVLFSCVGFYRKPLGELGEAERIVVPRPKGGAWRFRKGSFFGKTTGFIFALIFSHLLLDLFTEDLKAPYGFPLFWPFSETYVISSRPFLPYVMRDWTNPVFRGQIIRVFLVESLLFLPFFFLSWWLKRRG
jgi:hypothetical protein